MNDYQTKFVTPEQAVKVVQSGDWVDYGFGAGFPELLDKALAARKGEVKEINAAYEEITKMRSGSKSGGGSYGGGYGSAYGGYRGGSSGGYQQYSGQSASGSSVLQQVRVAINTGNLSRAEALLANYSDHNAEWNFLRGAVCYRRGWMSKSGFRSSGIAFSSSFEK